MTSVYAKQAAVGRLSITANLRRGGSAPYGLRAHINGVNLHFSVLSNVLAKRVTT
jgi:hypothetical protein